MKKYIISLVLGLFALTAAHGQNPSIFVCSDTAHCIIVGDSLLQHSKRRFKMVDHYMYDRNRFLIEYREVGNADKPKRLHMIFNQYTEGANPALEIAGTSHYELDAVTGAYLDVFPIWQRYIDPAADMEQLAKDGRTKVRPINTNAPNSHYYFRKADDNNDPSIWILQTHL